MPVVSDARSRHTLVLVALLLAAPQAEAEVVTHQFTGQVTSVTDGSGSSADLTGWFTVGQAASFEYTIERSTEPVAQDPNTSAYTDALTALSFTIGSWSGSGTPGYSLTTVVDNAPYDQYSGQVQGGISADPLGNTMLSSLTYTFDDVQGTVFDSKEIPRVFPDLGAFEGKTFTVLIFDFDQLAAGFVMVTLGGVTTQTESATWGRLKASYR